MPFANSGRLRHEVEVQTLQTQGDFQEFEAWITSHVVWAEIKPFKGRSPVEADQKMPYVTHTIKTRTNDIAITPKNRLKYGDRLFAIEYVNDVDENDHYYELGCTEAVL